MHKRSLLKRMTALFMTIVMVIGLMPNITLPAAAADQAGLITIGKVSDPSSFDNWKDYYGTNSLLPDGTRGISTWKAGGVWTDKSVYSDSTAFPNSVTMDNQANNFLVALSALASNKEIVGQSSTPTDSFLVLDVSGSMDDSDKAEGMVEAANRAIHSLMAQNRNNRVGVMLYSGTRNDNGATATTLLLPLEHYTTTSTVDVGTRYNPEYIPAYLTISDDNSSPDVDIASGVRYGNNQRPASAERTVTGATYIQRGLYDAWKEFEKVTDVKVPAGNVQAGIQRSPVIILMSDGRPTLATDKYNDVSLRNSNYGNGTENTTTWETVFLTQLTAAWVKGAVADHYGTDAKLYTLGLGTSNDSYATSVLDPGDTSNNNVLTWWRNFIDGTKRNDGTVRVRNSSYGQSAWDIPYDDDRFATSVGRNYVDNYWAAGDVDEMITAFQEIVAEIGLQSAYSATLVEKNEADLDGYITVQDELGAMMQVKAVKGILLGDKLFSGEEMAKSLNTGALGGVDAPTAYGDEFVNTVKERLGLTDKVGANNETITATAQAQQLIQAAYMDGQLSYNAATGAYSNYIGWYGDANNAYLGFWDKDTGLTATGAPAGAKYINKSYGYLGGASSEEGAADMMHIVVMVRTEITTGHQTVLFRIPSSLIPMVEYKVELEGDSLETATDITLTVTEADPIRLVYEVGLPDDVNSINIDQKVEEYLAKDGSNHIHKENGNYVFYANNWDNDHNEVAPDISQMTDAEKLELTKHVAESHFVPNTVNERFYIQEDSVVYTKNGDDYTPVTSGINANGTYYFARTIVTIVNGTAQAIPQYEQLQPATVANSANFQQNGAGQWEVKAGTIRQQLSNVILPKTDENGDPANYTATLPNTDQLWVNVTGSDPSDFNIYSFLGNNGKLTVAPATGIKVTKDVTELADGASANEEFAITVTIDAAVSNPVVTDVDGNLLTDYRSQVVAGDTIVTLNLADGESAVISGLPAGVRYTVSEAAHRKYTATYTGAAATVANTIVENLVTNEPVQPGSLYITKEVVHAHEGEAFPANYEFKFKVTFVDMDGNPIDADFQIENGAALSTDANGVAEVTLHHGETIHVLGIPTGTKVTVEEETLPADGNYALMSYRSHNFSGGPADTDGEVTIVSGRAATVVVNNIYTPKSTSVQIDVTAHKTLLSDAPVLSDVVLGFEVERWDPVNQSWNEVAYNEYTWNKHTITQGTATKDFTINTATLGAFTEAGIYTYRVVEVEPSSPTPGLAYDKTIHTIVVTVIDNNGQLEATVADENGDPITDSNSDGILDFTANFTNVFDYAPVSIEIIKAESNLSNTPQLSKDGFQFAAYEANSDWSLVDETADYTVISDSNGSARLTATYNAVGVHHYVVKELHTVKPGWTVFSSAEYRVTVTVAKDNAGNLVANMTIVAKEGSTAQGESASYNGNSGTIIFKNTYDPADAEVSLNTLVQKDLVGRDLAAGEFQFAIFENNEAAFDANGMLTNIQDAVATGTNDANGNVTFAPAALTFSQVGKYEYDVIEVKGSLGGVTYDSTIYDLVVEVTDNGNGRLQVKYYFEDSVAEQVTFQNTYTAVPTEVVIEGIKSIQVNSGVKILNAGDYTFELFEADAQGAPVGNPLSTTTNLANGTFQFDAIEYDHSDINKTFRYVVLEKVPDGASVDVSSGKYVLNGVTYSDAKFVVEVTITDNGDGTLKKDVTGNGANTIRFVNVYNSKLASVTLGGTKELDGRNLANGEYQFILHESNTAFTEKNAVVQQNGADFVSNDANGEFTFKIEGLGMGYHYYILSEVIPEQTAAGISYDASAYHITVQVSDSGNGQMSAMTTISHSGQPNVSNPPIVFKNVYTPESGELPLSGSKTYNGGKALENDVFSVGLYDASADLLQAAQIKANGRFAFENLEYTAADVGNTYTYTIKEIIPDGATDNDNGTFTFGKNIYDGSVYTLTVAITDDDKDGALNIETSLKKGNADVNEITFTNTFVPDPVTHVVKAKKTYEKGLEGDDFQFNLTSIDGKTNVNQTKENAANGDIIFDAISFPAAGEYKFKLTEKTDSLFSFILPSIAEYEITVTVVNENGVLRVSNVATVNTKNTAETDLNFVNTYVLDGEDEVTIRGTKKLTGGRTAPNANEFQFGLYDAAGELIQSVKNDANGNFAFTALKFDETDVPVNGQKQITYTVKEIAGSDIRVTYDQTVYTVVVTVEDNDEGGVTASYTVNGKDNGSITFTNVYTPKPEDITVDFDIVKTVVNKGSEKLSPEGFEFLLDALAEGVVDTTVKTDANGKAKFTLPFTEDDIGNTYTYKLTEVNGGKANVTYSTVEYTITVTIGLDENNKLVATLTSNGENATAVVAAFENVYDYTPEQKPVYPNNPQTGDNVMLQLWVALVFVSGGGILGTALYGKKRKEAES